MILKPFAWLVEIVVVIILTVIRIVFVYILLIIGLFFLGPLFMYQAMVLHRERTILMEKYISEGVSVDGVVMRRYNTWEIAGGSDGPSHVLVEHAIVKYEYGNDEYLMKLSPLRERVKDSIEPQGMIPIVLLREIPKSGIPAAVCVEEDLSCGHVVLYRTFSFSLGLAVSILWMTMLPIGFLLADEDKPDDDWYDPYFNDDSATSSQNDSPDWRILVAIVLLVGILPIALFFFWKGFRDCLSRNLTCFDLKLINDVEVKKIRSDGRGTRTNAN